MGDKDFETLANWGKKRDRKLNMSDRDQDQDNDHDMDKDEDNTINKATSNHKPTRTSNMPNYF